MSTTKTKTKALKPKRVPWRIPAPAMERFHGFADRNVRSLSASIHIAAVVADLATPELIAHAVEIVSQEAKGTERATEPAHTH